jgi:FkbM family methyltransferase
MSYHGQSIKTGGGSELPLDEILVERYQLNSFIGTAIECGANDGLYLSTCLCLEEFGWKVINIEASKANYDKLVRNRKIAWNNALSDVHDSTIMIQEYDYDNGGMNKRLGISDTIHTIDKRYNLCNVTTIRYDESIFEPIDLFVLDIEGDELKAIDGMSNTEYWPTIMCIEHVHCGLDSLIQKLKNRYSVDWLDSLNVVFKKT